MTTTYIHPKGCVSWIYARREGLQSWGGEAEKQNSPLKMPWIGE